MAVALSNSALKQTRGKERGWKHAKLRIDQKFTGNFRRPEVVPMLVDLKLHLRYRANFRLGWELISAGLICNSARRSL